MLSEVLEGLKELAGVITPELAGNAVLLFLILGALKGLGILKKESWIQFGNIFGGWLMNGRVVPDDFAGAQEWYMTIVLAAGIFQVYKLVRDNWEDWVKFFKKAKVSISVADTPPAHPEQGDV